MSHTKSRVQLRFLAPVLAALMVPTTVLAAAPSDKAAVSKASCQATAVLLSKEGDGSIPAELEFLKSTLQNDEFAAYKGFHLLERKAMKLAKDVKSEAAFASGHRMGLTLLGSDDNNRLKLHADLSSRDASKSLLSMDYSIENEGLVMIGAGSHTDATRTGKLFFAIQCGRSG